MNLEVFITKSLMYNLTMNTPSKKTSFLVLVITALLCSRAMFVFFNDPEGPNLLIVTVMAAILYAVSLAAYTLSSSKITDNLKKLLLSVAVQILVASIFYLFLS
ncbi:MAG: hypothetical protein V4465_00965 [Patescibacteria group bacterium]